MSDEYIYNVPPVSELGNEEKLDTATLEKFFEVNNEQDNEFYKSPNPMFMSKEIFYTPLAVDENKWENKPLRKSMSMNSIPNQLKDTIDQVSSEVNMMKISNGKINGTKPLKKTGSSSNLRRPKSSSRDCLNYLAQPKRYASSENLRKNSPFVSMAEAVRKFQKSTPQRFKSLKSEMPELCKPCYFAPTKPISPKFLTKQRSRTTHVLSAKDLEEKEVEEMKKYQIKANPVKSYILQGPIKLQKSQQTKPNTVCQPFNITQAPPKKPPSPQRKVEFHARPIPKSVLEPPKPLQKLNKITEAHTPKFSKRFTYKEKKPEPLKATIPVQQIPLKPSRTMPQPFSFEKRDQEMSKHREELIKKVLEDEKKAREFHAKPPPKFITANAPKNRSTGSVCSNKSDDLNKPKPLMFKAKSPSVLYKKPFIPEHQPHHLEVFDFILNTEKRAQEREEFEQMKRQKEEEQQRQIMEQREKEKRKAEEEAALLRKQAEFKANPIRKFNPFKIEASSKPVTDPKGPVFMTDLIRNKENINSNTTYG